MGKFVNRPAAKAKRGKPSLLIFGVSAAFAIAGVAIALAILATRPLKIALVGLDAAERKAIGRFLSASLVDHRIVDHPAGSLRIALSGPFPPDAAFLRAGLEASDAEASFESADAEAVRRIPQSLIWALSGRNEPKALPVLVDHFEIAWRTDRFAQLGLPEPTDRESFDKAAAAFKDPRAYAILFAGGDDETLLLALSAICVAQGGSDGYRAALSAISSSGGRFAAAAADSALGAAIGELRRWAKAGYLHPEWTKLSNDDVRSFMTGKLAFMVLQSLSFHRTVPYQTIFDYRAGPFPRYSATERSALVAPLTTVALPRRAYPWSAVRGRRAEKLVSLLSEPPVAFMLAETSGRSGALAAARAPDLQAADVLAWAAGSRVVVSGFYRDAFADPALASAFAAQLREALR